MCFGPFGTEKMVAQNIETHVVRVNSFFSHQVVNHLTSLRSIRLTAPDPHHHKKVL